METTDSFNERMRDTVASGAQTMGLAMGHRLGLLQLMASYNDPKTSSQIADAGNFKERYVREWLHAMVCFDVIETDSEGQRYFLPVHRRQALTGNHLGNMATLADTLADCGSLFQTVAKCFEKDGPIGIPIEKMSHFHSATDELSKALYTETSMAKCMYSVHGLMARKGDVLEMCDVGCGVGHGTRLVARLFPNANIQALDISEDAITRARQETDKQGITNITYHVRDIASLSDDWTNKFDVITAFMVIHDLCFPDKALSEMHRCLKEGGYAMVIDTNTHTSVVTNKDMHFPKVLYIGSMFQCLPLSLSQEGGRGLGTCWGIELAMQMLRDAGFKEVKQEEFTKLNAQYVCRK